jgi:RNA polymerase sigma factor (sigma-70 family)
MSDAFRNRILRSLRQLFGAAEANGLGDGELLRRFVQERDEAAFELLVWRHAGLVLNVCRGVLRDESAVEDAFQATFLVLIRKAGGIARTESLPAWLHSVAYRTALRARGRSARLAARLAPVPDLDHLPGRAEEPSLDRDVLEMLHEEISRLPDRYRIPVVCCYLESRTQEETARQLGWSKGTVAGRLARARELLRRRLARRGVTLTASAFVAGGLSSAATAGWSGRVSALLQGLRGLTTGESGLLSAGSPSAVALAEGVISEMFRMKVKWGLAVLAALCLSALGTAVGIAQRGQRDEEEPQVERPREEKPGPKAVAKEDRAEKEAEESLDEIAMRLLVRRNLKTLALAVLNYNDACGYLPPPAITDKNGKPLLSWRVAILPFIEQEALYKQFKLDEPWDSPHNKKLLARMPKVFGPVVKNHPRYSTFYQYVVGPEAVFTRWTGQPAPRPGGGTGFGGGMRGTTGYGGGVPPGIIPGGGGRPGSGGAGMGAGSGGPPGGGSAGMRPAGPGGMSGMGGTGGMAGMPPAGAGDERVRIPASIPDGTSNTLLIVEAGKAVPWTKPEDVHYHPRKPLPKLGGYFSKVFLAARADGAVIAIPKAVDQATLRALITPAGGEVLDWKKLERFDPGSSLRLEALQRMRKQNAQLKEEAATVHEILAELKAELRDLRWAVQQERLMKLDPEATELRKENEKLQQTLRQSRDEAAKIVEEIQRLKQEMKKRGKK